MWELICSGLISMGNVVAKGGIVVFLLLLLLLLLLLDKTGVDGGMIQFVEALPNSNNNSSAASASAKSVPFLLLLLLSVFLLEKGKEMGEDRWIGDAHKCIIIITKYLSIRMAGMIAIHNS